MAIETDLSSKKRSYPDPSPTHKCPSDIHHRKLPTYLVQFSNTSAHLWLFRSAGARKNLPLSFSLSLCKTGYKYSFLWRPPVILGDFSYEKKSCKDKISQFHFTDIWCWVLGFLSGLTAWSCIVWNPIFPPEYETISIWSLLFCSVCS